MSPPVELKFDLAPKGPVILDWRSGKLDPRDIRAAHQEHRIEVKAEVRWLGSDDFSWRVEVVLDPATYESIAVGGHGVAPTAKAAMDEGDQWVNRLIGHIRLERDGAAGRSA